MDVKRGDTTLNRLFAECARTYPELPALHSKTDAGWKAITYKELHDRVRRFGSGLIAAGIKHGDRVGILSENRPEWAVADLGALGAGAATVPIYPTLPASQVGHILSDSGAVAIVVSDKDQLTKVQSVRDRCPNLANVIMMDPAEGAGSDIHTFESINSLGDLVPSPNESDSVMSGTEFDRRREAVRPSDLASLVYTSGTTGDPKGAMLSHSNFCAGIRSAMEGLPIRVAGERFLSFLPLCHVYERVTYYIAITNGAETYYAESIFKVQDNMATTKPTLVQTVPRLLEVIHEKTLDHAAKLPPDKQKAFHEAIKVGGEVAKLRNDGKSPGPLLAAKYMLFDKLVLSQIREKLGGQLRYFVSGGAPLRREPAEFFNAIGVPMLEGYGLTESTAAATVNPAERTKVGTVGKPFPGVSVRLAADGEILIKGEIIMQGYWNHPEATAEVIDADGWLHTGDIGTIDEDGYITITDRKKDILVLANGKNVAPQPIEGKLRAAKFVADIVLLGDHSGTVSALVVPDFKPLAEWAKAEGIDFERPEHLAASPVVRKEIKRNIDALSGDLAEFEKVRKIALLDHAFSVDNGELTPTLKVKRKVIKERYGGLLE